MRTASVVDKTGHHIRNLAHKHQHVEHACEQRGRVQGASLRFHGHKPQGHWVTHGQVAAAQAAPGTHRRHQPELGEWVGALNSPEYRLLAQTWCSWPWCAGGTFLVDLRDVSVAYGGVERHVCAALGLQVGAACKHVWCCRESALSDGRPENYDLNSAGWFSQVGLVCTC